MKKTIKLKSMFLKVLTAIMMTVALLPAGGLFATHAEDAFTIIDDMDPAWDYSAGDANGGGWGSWGSADHIETEHWSNSAGATVNISFNGTKLELFGKKDPVHAMFSVQIDDGEVIKCDEYADTTQHNQLVYTSPDLTPGDHVAKVTVLGERNPNSTGSGSLYGIQFVYAKAYGGTPVPVETPDPDATVKSVIEDTMVTDSQELFKIRFTGDWHEERGYGFFSNGDDHYSNVGGDSFEMVFIGSKFEIGGSKNPGHGIYDVYVDDELVGEADATSTSGVLHKQILFTSEELPETEHVLKVVNRVTESQKAIQVDFINVYHKPISAKEVVLSDTSVRMETGMTKQIEASVLPDVAVNKKLVWTSDDDAVATVSDTGEIKAISEADAKTKVTATVEGTDVAASVEVTVISKKDVLSATVADAELLETQREYDSLCLKESDTWNATAWKNDILNSKIAVCSRENEVKNAEITVSDFSGDSGTIPASNFEVKWQRETLANIGRGNYSAPVQSFPDILYEGGKTDIPAKSVKFAWIGITIPKDTVSGTYTGTVTVRADGLNTPYTFTYTIEVLDFIAPDNTSGLTDIEIWQHPFSVAEYYGLSRDEYFTEKHFVLMRDSMKEYRELGGDTVVTNIVEEAWNHQSYYSDPSMVTWTKKADGTFGFDYTWYDAWVKFQIEAGVIDPENGQGKIQCYSIVPWNNQIAYYDESSKTNVARSYAPGSEDWKTMWNAFLTDFLKHSDDMGWLDITYISMDERGMSDLKHAVDMIESVKTPDGRGFKISSCLNYQEKGDYAFTDRIHDVSINTGSVDRSSEQKTRAFAEHRNEKGLVTTLYTCTGNYPGSFIISDPVENEWVMWYTLSQDANGFLRWAWDNWVSDPLTNVTYKYWEPADGWFVYPGEKDGSGNAYFYTTPKYEMLKQGIKDINKAKYLMEAAPESKEEVKALIQSLQVPRSGGNGYGSATWQNEGQRELCRSEVERMRNGINELARKYLNKDVPAADYSALQESIAKAEEILKEKDSYEEAGITVLEDVLQKANDLVEAGNATQAEIDTQKAELDEAIAGIKEKSEESHTFTENDVSATISDNLFKAGYEFHCDVVPVPEDYKEYNADAYDIYFTVNGERRLPEEEVYVRIPKKELKGQVVLVHIGDAGMKQDVEFTDEGSNVAFRSKDFSVYVLREFEKKSDGSTPEPTPTPTPTATPKPGTVSTGIESNIAIWAVTGLLAVISCGVVVVKRIRHNK